MAQQSGADPVDLFARAARQAEAVMARVTPIQLGAPTPCTEWTVQDLVDHMVGGTDYLRAAIAGRQPHTPRSGRLVDDYREGVQQVLEGLRAPDVLERTCQSPLDFQWTLGQAVAGTFMDQLIHTWDLARATGQDGSLDPALVATCSAMFLPDMPELGRSAGLVGPAVEVPPGAGAQEQLLAAMGRQP